MIKKVIRVVLAFLCNGMSVGLFIQAGFGLDSISVFSAGLANQFHTTIGIASLGLYFVTILMVSEQKKLSFRICKIVFDISIIIEGILMGGTFGFGTVVFGFVTGPAIQFF